jgi:phosphohistidine phosphatase
MSHPIELYLVRHGVAAERGDAWPDDAKRPLTAKGIERFRDVAEGLRTIHVVVDVVLTSPLVRAKQTAELLAAGLAPHPAVQATDALAPGAAQGALADAIERTKQRRVACVGHEPDLGLLAAHLVGARRPFEFRKGGVCRIDLESPTGPGHLVWLATPRLLRHAGR